MIRALAIIRRQSVKNKNDSLLGECAHNMEFLHDDVQTEYERWKKHAGENDPYKSKHTVGLHDVLRAHFLIVDFFWENSYGIGGIGPRSMDLLHSAIYRQFVSFGAKEKWQTAIEKVATLMFGLVKDHPFYDANKRTALLVTLFQLDRLKRVPRIGQKELEEFIVEVADNRLAKYARYNAMAEHEEDAEVRFIADFLKRNTREVDTRHYVVTYHQLRSRLQKYGFDLCHPDGNYIDVVRVEYAPKYLRMMGPKVRRERRLTKIGFPGWKRQLSRNDLKEVRKATGLTPERGYDSSVFNGNEDPLHALIDIYSEPLKRLSNR